MLGLSDWGVDGDAIPAPEIPRIPPLTRGGREDGLARTKAGERQV